MLLFVAIAIAGCLGLFVSLLGMVVALRPRRSKGAKGERMVASRLKDLDPGFYRVFHDLYLPRPDGTGSTQVDHVVLSRFGVFVIETKYFDGWIFGGVRQKMWTQSIYGRNTQFQNPLHQNHLHVLATRDFLGFQDRQLHSLVFFVDGDFRSEMPENVLCSDLCGWIGLRRQIQLSDHELQGAIGKLEQLEKSTDRKAARARHLQDLKRRKSEPEALREENESPGIPVAAAVPPPLPPSPWAGPRPSPTEASGLSPAAQEIGSRIPSIH